MSSGSMTYNPGQQFRIRMKAVNGAAAVNTAVVSRDDLETIGGAYLSLTTAGSTTQVVDTKLSNVNTYLGRTIEFTSNANATSLPNVGLRRVITGYVVATQTITFNALPAQAQVGDRYKVLSPCRGVNKIALANVFNDQVATSSEQAFRVAATKADGDKWLSAFYEATGVPFYGNGPHPIPVEFSLGDGDLTLTATTVTATWLTDVELVWHFVY